MHAWVDVRYVSQFRSTEPETCGLGQGPSYLCLLHTGVTGASQHTGLFLFGFWGSNSGPHACIAGILRTELSPHRNGFKSNSNFVGEHLGFVLGNNQTSSGTPASSIPLLHE